MAQNIVVVDSRTRKEIVMAATEFDRWDRKAYGRGGSGTAPGPVSTMKGQMARRKGKGAVREDGS